MRVIRFRRVYQDARKELDELVRDRQRIDKRISELQPIVESLAVLLHEVEPRTATQPQERLGLTDSVRETLKSAYVPLRATAVKERMKSAGFDFGRYSKPLASVHVILNRLVKSGEVKIEQPTGKNKTYQWVTAVDHVINMIARIEKGKGFKG